jgi:hypothetical protein
MKETVMKKKIYMVVAMFALLTVAGVSNASAQSQPKMQLKANIPFAFTVGDKTMPAGEYSVTCTNPSSDQKVLQLRSSDGNQSALLRTSSVIGKTQDAAQLVFNRYGDHYFFAQVWLPADATGMQAPKSHGEKQMARELAARKSSKETVSVIAIR